MMKMKKCCLVALFALAVLCLAAPGTAATKYVTETGAGVKDGSNWDNASDNLKDVMNTAESGDDIWVAVGTYSPGNDVTDTFKLNKGVKVYGGFAGGETALTQRNWETNKTVLSGGNSVYHVVTGGTDATSADTRLDGFTVTGGNANGPNEEDKYGGGMYNDNSSPTVVNCTFSGNTAQDEGGGMHNAFSSPTVENCIFSGNGAAKYGGGMYNWQSSSTVANCTFSGNEAAGPGGGGGMYNVGSSPTVENCTFSGNEAAGPGGGMGNNSSSPRVENCTFSGNTADMNGGMSNWNSSPTVVNCTFSGNKAERGGGMGNRSNSSPRVANCTFSGNTAAKDGGGMYNQFSSPGVVNCTFSGNTAAELGGGMHNNNSSPTVVNCTFSRNTATSSGGGMLNWASSLTVVNTILWGNVAPNDNSGPDIYQSGGTLTLNHCVVGKYVLANGATEDKTNLIRTDPLLTELDVNGDPVVPPAELYVYGLKPSSPALDAGLNVGTQISGDVKVPDVDQLGTTRPQNGKVDIGAFEKPEGGTPPTPPAPPPGPGGGGGSGGCDAGMGAIAVFALLGAVLLHRKDEN